MKYTKFAKRVLVWMLLIIFSSMTVSAGSAVITPNTPLPDDDLVCTATGGSGYYSYYWYKDFSSTPSRSVTWTTSTFDILSQSYTSGRDTWTCKVEDSVSSVELGSDSVQIVDVDPVNVNIAPDPAYTTDNLTCSHDGTSAYGYLYQWLMNGAVQSGLTTDTVDYSYTARDETWRCEIIHGFALVVVGEDELIISNILPVADPQTIGTDEDNAVNITLTGSDGDGDTYTFLINLNASNGNLTSFNPSTGEVTYIPDLDFNGVDSFSFMANDGTDNSIAATVNITVNPVDDAPVVGDIINVSFDEDGSNNTIDLDDYLTEVDGDLINWSYSGNGNVTVSIDSNNVITFGAAPDWSGIETITFTATDDTLSGLSDSDDVVVTVSAVNDTPYFDPALEDQVIDEDSTLTYDINASDADIGDVLAYTSNISLLGGAIDSVTGILTWTPVNADVGVHDIVVEVCDDSGALNNCTSDVINISVINTNDVPVFDHILEDQIIDEDSTLTYDINASDVDIGDSLSFSSNITLLGGSIDANGVLTWTPVNDDVGVHDIMIEVCDDSGAVNNCTSDVINITVINTNDAPIFDHVLEDQIVDEDSTLTYDINASDVDIGDTYSFSSNITLLGGVIDANTGILTWTPDNSYVGSHLVDVIVCDDSGAVNNCTNSNFTITVNNTNDAPVAYNVVDNTNEDTEIIITLNHSDVDVGDLAETCTISNLGNGTETTPCNCTAGVCTVGLTPLLDSIIDITADYIVNDGDVDSNTANITVTVNPVNDAPVFDHVLEDQIIDEDSTLTYDINASDVDIGDSLSFSSTNIIMLGGSIDTLTGVLTWTPVNNNVGVHNIIVEVCDDSGAPNNCTSDAFNITVNNTNDAPVAYNVVGNTNEDAEIIVTLNHSDVDVGDLAETCTISNLGNGTETTPCNCTAGVCTVGLTPLLDSIVDVTADYTVNDGDVNSNTANITVTVNAVNDAPVAYDVIDNTNEDTEVIVTLNYTDAENDPAVSCSLIGAVVGGTETTLCSCVGGVCTVGLTPLANSTADINANYTVNDGSLDSNIASITVTINAVNDAPYFDPALVDQIIDEGFTLIYDINASDADPNDILSFSSNITLLGGSIDNNGVLAFPTNNNLKGNHTVEVIVCDDSGAVNNCTSDTFMVTVNDIPIVAFTTGPYISFEGSPVNFSGFAAGGSVPYYYIWDFDGDGTYDTTWSLTPDTSNTWNDDFFSGDALLLVNDSIGELANATTSITILNVAPTANANGPYYCMDGDSITLNGSATDPSPIDTLFLNYTWDLDNDGVYETNIEDPTYTCDISVSSVNLNVSDKDGGSDIATAIINVVSALSVDALGPYVNNEGSAILFDGTATGGYLPYSYRWDLDNDGTWDTAWLNSDAAYSNTWYDNYTGIVALQVNDSVGHLANDTATVTVLNVAPIPNSGGPYTCTMGDNIALTGSATDPGNDTISYAWDLDDDGIYEITGLSANFSCINYGLYPVNFSASDEDGGVGIDSTYVFVGAQNITLDANGPYSGTEGSPISFNGSVIGGLFPHQFRWDFDNDGVWDTSWSSTADASYAYPDDYTDVAVLQVNDSLGGIAIDTTNVTVTNVAPTANAGLPYSCIIGQNITLTGSATDPGTGDILTYSWDLENDSIYETPGQNVIFECTANGTYPVNLRVEDDDGGFDEDSTYVTVSVPTLQAYADGPYVGAEGFVINSFTGSGAGGVAPYQFRWDFNNDGTWDTTWSSTADASWTYNDDYNDVAVLDVMDSLGSTANDTASVTVNNIAPTAEANGPYSCNEGQVITLTGSATDPGSDILTYAWDLNNDSTYETPGQYPTYTCGTIGSYIVGLRVTDDDSGSSTDTAVISVGTAPDITPPIVGIISPQPIIYTTTNITVSITASDASGINRIWYTINGGTPIDYYGPIDQIFGDNAAYTLTAYASDMIGNVGSASVGFIVNSTYGIIRDVEGPEPRYIIKLDRIRMSNDGFINIGDDLRTTISLSNIGNKDLEDARITVVIPELGIWKRVGPLDLDKGERETREIVLDMPDDVEPGEYIARIVVSNSKTRRVVHRPIIIE